MVLRKNVFNRVCFLSAISVFLLFVLGGLVRSTGSGMGCPDWPKCFGTYIPPTHESELPSDYKDKFLEKRLKKVERFTRLLNFFGFTHLVQKVTNDPYLKIAHPYNKATAYTEWINRLFGVLTGFLALLTIITGFKIRKDYSKSYRWAIFGTFWVIFNGWLGSVVVDTNLVPGIVTAHYAAAYLAMFGFIMAISNESKFQLHKTNKALIILSLILLLTDIFLGTTSREIIDSLKQAHHFELSRRTIWIPGTVFLIHRIIGVLVFMINLVLGYRLYKSERGTMLFKLHVVVIFLFSIQIVSGFINVLYDIPPFINIFHISASAAIVGIQIWIIKQFKN
jgi:cytochrome c oxidase assembly protein subunit 15